MRPSRGRSRSRRRSSATAAPYCFASPAPNRSYASWSRQPRTRKPPRWLSTSRRSSAPPSRSEVLYAGPMTAIEPLDPNDDAQFAEFYSVYASANAEEWDRPYSAHEKRLALLEKSDYQEVVGALGRDADGVAVVAGTVDFSLKDNVDVGFVEVGVTPEHRRQGHGTAMLN